MINLKSYRLYEAIAYNELPGEIPSDVFFTRIGFPPAEALRLIDWWDANRARFDVHYFPFKGNEPIMGVFFDDHVVAINQKAMAPPPIKLFIALHESRHADQYSEGRFEEPYFGTVLAGDREGFLAAYSELEGEANDYAFNCMNELGFGRFIMPQERLLRGNETQGPEVYDMMRADIAKWDPKTFSELLMHQII